MKENILSICILVSVIAILYYGWEYILGAIFFLLILCIFHSFFFTGIIYKSDDNGNKKLTKW